MTCRLLLATNNKGKVGEFRDLLSGAGFELVMPDDLGITMVVAETGVTYEENARLKATSLARESGVLSLGDDSGLEVDALGGEPGLMSARYAGDGASDSIRVRHLLSKLSGVPWERRTARFVCVIALATPAGQVYTCEGACHGMIGFEPKGEFGFGYDPVFYFPGLDRTMAELSPETKHRVSHRGQAAEKARQVLSRPPFACL